jgi:precorrin-3B C17-methyltransferase
MLTTVLIGNSNTIVQHGLMVTPRGYANKYDMQDGGSTREGERPGRSLSTGLNGWLENLIADHAAGDSVETLAERHRLPADYIRATLNEPLEASAADAPEEAEA